MSNPQHVWRVNKLPRFTVLEFGELMAADDGPRETFLRDSKFEKVYRSIGYRDVNRTVRRFLSSATRNPSILLEGQEAIQQRKLETADPKERANLDLQAAALAAFAASLNSLQLSGREFEAVTPRQTGLNIEGVDISVHPTVWVRQRRSRGRDMMGALIVDPAMGTPLKTQEAIAKDKRAKDVSCSLMHLYVSDTRCGDDEVAEHELCSIFHVHRKQMFTAPTGYKKELKNIEAVCRWAMDRWDKLKPPPSFDESKARYR